MPSPLLLPDPAADETDRLLAELEKRIHKEYKQAIKEADKKWRDYLSAFDAQDKVEAERLAKGEITKAEYQDWRRRHLAQGKHWEEMRNVMAQDYHNRNLIAAKLADNSMADVYAVNANYGTYMIEHSGKFDTGFTLYNHDSAEALLKEEWSINPETGRNSFMPAPKPEGRRARELEGLRTTNPDVLWNAKNIQSAMMQGVLSGESMTSLARRLAGVAVMDEHQAIRNARTLTTNVQNKGRMDAGDRIKKLGGQMVDEWSAILDGRTRHSHRHMHGERKDHDSEEPFSNGCRWPGDPAGPPAEVWNCRCRVKLWAKGFEGETIKHSDAMGNMTFEEWQNAKVPKEIRNESRDKKQLEEYKKILGKDAPKSLDEFQKIKYNDPAKWEYTKGLKQYLQKYPDSKKAYYDVQQVVKTTEFKNSVVLPPKPKTAYILETGKRDPSHIMKRMVERGITDDQLRGYVKNAKVMLVQWGGERQVFIGNEGTAVITKVNDDWIFRTAWTKYDNTEGMKKILEAIKNAGL